MEGTDEKKGQAEVANDLAAMLQVNTFPPVTDPRRSKRPGMPWGTWLQPSPECQWYLSAFLGPLTSADGVTGFGWFDVRRGAWRISRQHVQDGQRRDRDSGPRGAA